MFLPNVSLRIRAECEVQTKGFHDAKYKKFARLEDAELFVSGSPSDIAALAVSSNPTSSDPKGKKRAFGPEVADTTGWDIVYSDGACKGNGKVGSIAGVGVWWGVGDPRYFIRHLLKHVLTLSIEETLRKGAPETRLTIGQSS